MTRSRLVALSLLCAAAGSAAAQKPQPGRAQDSWIRLDWRLEKPIGHPIGMGGPSVARIGDRLVVAGGACFPDGPPWDGHPKRWFDRIETKSLFDPHAEWKLESLKLPQPLAYAVTLQAENAKAILIGGCDAKAHSARCWALTAADNSTLQLEPYPPLPMPLAYAAGARLGSMLCVAGGLREPEGQAARPEHVFLVSEPAKGGDWSRSEPWPGPARFQAVCGTLEGWFYVVSGFDLDPETRERRPLRDAYRWHPDHGWFRIADLPRPVGAAAPAFVVAGKLAILGGASVTHDGPPKEHPGFSTDILVYDVDDDRWEEASLEMRSDQGVPLAQIEGPVTTGAVSAGGRIFVASGEIRPGVRTRRVFSIDTRQGGERPRQQLGPAFWIFLALIGFMLVKNSRSNDDEEAPA